MANFNSLVLIGHLVQDPNLKTLPSGTTVVNGSIAVNRNWTNDQGQKCSDVTFLDYQAFAGLADVMAKHLHKGDPCLLAGEIRLDRWQDPDGTNRYRHYIHVLRMQFIGGRTGRQADHAAADNPDSDPPHYT